MAFLVFSDSGYEYLDQGDFVLFSENNTHDLLFEYVTKDLSGLQKLFADYVDTRLDKDSTPIGNEQSGKDIISQILEALKSVHKYYEFECKKTTINELGKYFNNLLKYLYRMSNFTIEKEEYSKRFIWLLEPLLIDFDKYHIDFYNEYREWLGKEFYISTGSIEDYETVTINNLTERPSGFYEEIRTQKDIRDMLYFILDIDAESMGSLKTSQRMWLYANLLPDYYSEMSVTRHLSFNHKHQLSGSYDRIQEMENIQDLKETFATLHSLDNQAITMMEEEMKCCFKKAIEVAKSVREIPRYEKYEIDTLKQLLYLEIISMIQKDTIIRKCRNCNRYFVASNRKVAYCDRIDDTGKRCSSVGSLRSFQKKMAEEEELKIYTRAYKTHFARLKKGTMKSGAFEKWCAEAKEKLEQVRAGALDIDTFQKWLKE